MAGDHLDGTRRPDASRTAWVLLFSGLLGFRVGMAGFPDWQVAVETSQVIAGLVKYPAGNPFFVYHIKLWTILHQLLAPLLRLGVSEIRLSLVISGVLGMVTFQALSMVVYALSRDALLAAGAAAFIFFSRAADYGGVYGLFLLGTENTYGILGLSFCLLAVAVIAAGAYRSGAFLLAVSPAVHPSLGVWTGVIASGALLLDPQWARQELRPAARWFLIGCGVTLASLALQLAIIYRAPHAPPSSETFTTRELTAFITFWDGHRRPVNMRNGGVFLNFGALAMAAVWLLAFKRDLPRAALFLLRVAVVSAVLSILLIFVSWVPPDRLPAWLLVFMPGRVLNFDALLFAAMLMGLVGIYRQWCTRLLMTVFVIGLMTSDHSMLWDWLLEKRGLSIFSSVRPMWIFGCVSVGLIVARALCGRSSDWPISTNERRVQKAGPALRAAGLALHTIAIAVLALAAALTLGFSRPRSLIFRDRTNDVFFEQIASARGLLLTAGDLHLIQLKTRRPVLLDGGGLDGVMYSLEAGPAMKRILADVYGIDLLNPPEEARGAGRIPPMANRQAWEAYPAERWRQIGREYGVTQVLTYPDWTLDLPLAAQSRRLLLYQIPQ